MNLSELFVRRPVMTVLVMVGIMLFGLVGYRLLPVSSLPNIDFPTIQVSAELPGASPETMASAVATPLERQFTTIAGIDSMTSVSQPGHHRDHDPVLARPRHRRRGAGRAVGDDRRRRNCCPPTMTTPPSFRKVNPADFPIFYLALTSDAVPLYTVNEYAETYLAQRISTISGVAQVQVFGQQKYAVRVQVDPNALAARGIGINEVEQAVAQANVNLPTGTLYGKSRTVAVQATGQLYNAETFRPVIVTYRNGSPVRLKELGRVVDSVQNDKVAAWFKGNRGIVLAIQRQPGTNTIEIVDRIKALLPAFRAEVPPSINIEVLFDRSVPIRASVHEVQITLLIALVLVVLVIFVFLRSLRATTIPSVALPLSIVGTFAFMYLLRVQHRQPVAHGAHALRRLRGGRRDRDAREHLAAHRGREVAAPGGARRLARDLVHDPVDDDLARGGVPAGPVHGRDPRAPAARVRRDHHHRGADLRVRVAHPDADDVRAGSCARTATSATAACTS